MSVSSQFTKHRGVSVPKISGAKGKGGGKITPNSFFSTDILFVTVGLGEGPLYRVNPNGPQDIQIQDNNIEDLINMQGDGLENQDKFKTAVAYGTLTQGALPLFGDAIITPQQFSSAVSLKKGNLEGIPSSSITYQETSTAAWDALRFVFIIDSLYKADDKGNVSPRSLQVKITIWNNIRTEIIAVQTVEFSGKTDKAYKRSVELLIPEAAKSDSGYTFDIEKVSDDEDDAKIGDSVKIIGWDEIENTQQAYPRTALIGYALKAVDEHTGGVPTFTSLLKGLPCKVPSNYNQPILSNGEIDWREVETKSEAGTDSYITNGYCMQQSGPDTVLYAENPEIYIGTWDGSFIYSWTQNPIWILYDILTNKSYGLGIPEENIDKYRFYQIAQYCDACDPITGKFTGVSGLADGSYRHKPKNTYTSIRNNQLGIPKNTPIIERRFITDISLVDQEKGMDVLNKIAATFRAVLVYSGGKITIAIDMPEEYPAMLFNETNIKAGSFQISGSKESDVYTGVDVTYIEPTNHFKRETIRIDSLDSNDGTDSSDIENIASLDLAGVTRRGQAIRMAQYQLASSKYLRRSVSFTTSTDALTLAPGDVISVSSQGTGVAYGFGGKIVNTSNTGTSNTNVYLEHFTVPSLSTDVFSGNTNPLALRVINRNNDRTHLYILSNTTYNLSASSDVVSGYDLATVKATSIYNTNSKTFTDITTSGFTANSVPSTGDLWSIGEIENVDNYYSSKAGKLFKVTEIKRDPSTEEITVSALEYISNIYVDSDTFINYEPTAYTDIISPFAPPPTPNFTFTAKPRTLLDGSVVVDGIINNITDRTGYTQKFETEYYISSPTDVLLLSNVTATDPLTFTVSNASSLANNTISSLISGKNGFITSAGVVKLLCNTVSADVGSLTFTLEGLSSCYDENFNQHILDAISSVTLSGVPNISIPVLEKTSNSSVDFVSYYPTTTKLSQPITSYDIEQNTITVADALGGSSTLSTKIPNTPFYVEINQLLTPTNYSNNSFYIEGSSFTYNKEGLLTGTDIPLEVFPRSNSSVILYVDGLQKSLGQYTVNLNKGLSISPNVSYATGLNETNYRLSIEYYTVPTIEIGDYLEVSYANTFTVANTSYDLASPTYNAALTSNSVYRIELVETPTISLAGYSIINTTQNPTGIINNVSGNTFTFDYNSATYPGLFNLANSRVYSLEISSVHERYFLSDDNKIPELPLGLTSIRARNKNTIGRVSPYVQQSIFVQELPIQKVENLTIQESLYREQTGGVSVRVTVLFDHIVGQEVTDYEISYKFTNVDSFGIGGDGGTPLQQYNTVKVSANGVDDNNRINFTINNVNRGTSTEDNSIEVRVTPLNKSIRGITATFSKSIVGKTAKPLNIINFTGGQQGDLITFFWGYVRQDGGDLYDLDLKEVEIRKITGNVSATLENFLIASNLVTVSAGSGRKSVPIDSFGEFTYLAMTRDSSGNLSEEPVAITLNTTRAKRNTVVAAYNEDDPTTVFAGTTNDNSTEVSFTSFANSNTGGIAYSYTSAADNANASSSGWSAIGGLPTDLLATASAEYVTPIRDFGQPVTGSVSLFINATQEVQSTFNDQHEEFVESVSDVSSNTTVLVDSSFGGIGHLLGFSNVFVPSIRYDANNKTLMSGGTSGNVWGIWNHGQFTGDTANANSYALIAGVINANAIVLGSSYYANGQPSGSNSLANITTTSSTYTLVNFKQYNDYLTSTYVGDLGAISTQTYIRTSTSDPYYANGNVNTSVFSSSSDGFVPYEVGVKTFRYLQIKYIVNNSSPDQFDFTLDKFRYTIDKEQTLYSNTVPYSSSPTTVDFSEASFLYRPAISYAILDQIDSENNAALVVTTAASNSQVSFKLFASDGTGAYQANNSANIMITAIGV